MRALWVLVVLAVGCGRSSLSSNLAGDTDAAPPQCPVCEFTSVCLDGACVPAGVTWSGLAGSGAVPGIVPGLTDNDGTSVAVDGSGAVWVAAATGVGTARQPYVYRYDGSSWTMPGSPITTAAATYMELAIGPDGTPYAAWVEGAKALRVYHFDGTLWQPVGGSDVGNGVNDTTLDVGNSPIKVDRNGVVYLGFTRYDASGVGTICLYRFDGSAWAPYPGTETDGVSGPTAYGGAPDVAIADDGFPVVVWDFASGQKSGVFDGNDHIYLRRYDGSTWAELQGSATQYGLSVGTNHSWNPKVVALAGPQLAVAWYELEPGSSTLWHVHARQWTGSGWIGLGNSATTATAGLDGVANATNPALVADAYGRLVVSFSSVGATEGDINVLAWNGSVWEQIAGSNGPGGISQLDGFAFNAGLALAPHGGIVVAWAWANSTGPVTRGLFARELILNGP